MSHHLPEDHTNPEPTIVCDSIDQGGVGRRNSCRNIENISTARHRVDPAPEFVWWEVCIEDFSIPTCCARRACCVQWQNVFFSITWHV